MCQTWNIISLYYYLTTTLSKLTPIWTHLKMPLFGPFFGTFSHFQPQITGNVLPDPPGCQPNSLEPFKGEIWMSPKNSHGFQNVSIFLQNLFKSFRISGTQFSATDHTCTTSRQLTHYNLGMSQLIKAENLALKSQIWKHPKMPFFGPFFGPFSSLKSPNNW